MHNKLISSFAVRLRDVLGTLETAALIGAVDARVRGLGEQLQFACLALPCDEAFVALELNALGRLTIPGIAGPDGWRPEEREILPSGTPFAFLLGGGSGFATEVQQGDALLEALGEGALSSHPQYATFVPIRVGATVLGGAALLREQDGFGDAELNMAERLGEVLSLTVESYRTERVLLSVFASVLPDLCSPDRATDFVEGLERYLHTLRIGPEYRRRLQLAETVGRIAAAGPAETRLVNDVLTRVDSYLQELTGGQDGEALMVSEELLTDELYE
jgi:hypothetical protein